MAYFVHIYGPGGSLSVTESPKVTAEEERVEAAPTKDTDISGLRELG